MWYFLAQDKSGPEAVEVVADLIRNLRDLVANISNDPLIAANSYLLWAETAETRLREYFDSRDLVHSLHSERYWRVREIDRTTIRAIPLIRGESEAQIQQLESIRHQLEHYSARLSLQEDSWLVVCDTNVHIHGKLCEQVEWHRAIGVSDVCLVVPLIVIDELDKIKDDDRNYRDRAKSVLRMFDRLTRDRGALDPIQLRRHVTLQILNEPRGHIRQQRQDDEIVRQAEYFARLNGGRLVIVTRDRGMRVRAQAAGLTSKILPEELLRIRESAS